MPGAHHDSAARVVGIVADVPESVLMAAASTRTSHPPVSLPSVPYDLKDSGLPFSFLADLLLKVLYIHGGLLGRELAAKVCLPYPIVDGPLKFLLDEAYCQSAGMKTHSLESNETLGAGMQYIITNAGQARAREVMSISQYAGPAPVTIESYVEMAKRQASGPLPLDWDVLKKVFGKLVIPADLLERLGPALSSRQAIFLYGPAGNGKTSIAEATVALCGGPIFVPHALYVQGEVIRFLDPVYHHHHSLGKEIPSHDLRWELVDRPIVKVGGELSPAMLGLGFNGSTGYYEASHQLKANGGIFLIDDFGRQQNMSTVEILNRLIVPLENGVDYLNLVRGGTSVPVPFTALLILSTNLAPQSLMDEAFFRRVKWKIEVSNPLMDEYVVIWKRVCEEFDIPFSRPAIDRLVQVYYREKERDLHGAHPRDLAVHLIHIAKYQEVEPELSDELLDSACATYFVDAVPEVEEEPAT